jgi:hypothetical protein
MAQHDIVILQRNASNVWVERTLTATAGYIIRFDPATSILIASPFPVFGTMAAQDADAVAITGGTINPVSLLQIDNALGTAKALRAGLIGANANRTGAFPAVGIALMVDPEIDLHIASGYGADDDTGIYVDSFGPSFSPIVIGRRASGSFATPTASLVNQILALFGGRAHDGTIFDTFTGGSVQIVASENRGPADGGTRIEFWITPNGSITPQLILTLDQDGIIKTVGPVETGGSLRVGPSGSPVSNVMSTTGTLDFASIAAGASEDLTIALAGVAVGDSVSLGLPAAPEAGIIFQGFVSAADTVTVRATNITAAPIDPASADYRVTVFNY